MPGVGEEAAGISEHSHEVPQHASGSQTLQLGLHAVLAVIEPPGRAVLQLAADSLALIAAHKGHQSGVIVGIQRIEDGLGQGLLGLQRIQQACQIRQVYRRADAVIAGIGPQLAEHPGIIVALGGEVQLHDPAPPGIATSKVQQQRRLILPQLLLGDGEAGQPLLQDGIQRCRVRRAEHDVVQSVVGYGAAVSGEVVHPAIQRRQQGVHVLDLRPGRLREFSNVIGKV